MNLRTFLVIAAVLALGYAVGLILMPALNVWLRRQPIRNFAGTLLRC